MSVEPYANLTIAMIRYRCFGPDRFKSNAPKQIIEAQSYPQQMACRCRVVMPVQTTEVQQEPARDANAELFQQPVATGHDKSVCNNDQNNDQGRNKEISKLVESNESTTAEDADTNNVGTILDVMA